LDSNDINALNSQSEVENLPVEIKPLVLLVDDEPDTLMLIGYSLEKAGFEVLMAENGPVALQKVTQRKPNIALLDRMLPGMDGIELLGELRKVYPDLLVIMLTALTSENDRIEGWEAGVDDYVPKPVNFKELTFRVKSWLRRSTEDPVLINAVSKIRAHTTDKVQLRVGLTEASSGKLDGNLLESQINEGRRIQAILLKASRAALAGDNDRAHELYGQALELDTKNEIALKWLAYHTTDPHEGCRYLERLIEVQPGNIKAQKLLEVGRRRIEEIDRKSFSSIMSILNTPAPPLPAAEPGVPRRRKLGEILVDKGFISKDNIETAASLQEIFRRSGEPKKLGEILVEYGYLTEEQLQRVLTEQES
jgi:DNA-binding response OmpR family regulator